MEALHQSGDIIAQRYRILNTLGQGGNGITYEAKNLKTGERVALKALSLHHTGDWKQIELFEREAKVLAQLNYPAIPRYLDYFQVETSKDKAFYIVQELAEGKSLADLVKNGWRTNESGVRQIATQVLETLVYLHHLNPPVVHRDIKPQNLIWGKDGKIFLVDFGAVQDTVRSTFAKGSTIVGTYGYMAPEQFRGQAVPATDLYGLGATVVFLLTHRCPSDLPTERLKISFRSRIQVSEGFADWLEKMLEPDVEERFASAKVALKALQGRMVVAQKRSFVPWVGLVGVGIAGVLTFTVLNFYKWAILGTLGFRPALCEAIFTGDVDTVKNYLDQGGKPYALDAEMPEEVNNDTPNLLDCALHSREEKILQLMISHISNIKTRDNQGRTPLHFAAALSDKDIAKKLINKQVDVNSKDNQGNTPLHSVRSPDVAALLIDKGADVNAKNNKGNTPLHSVRSPKVVALLIDKGADVNAKDNQGNTLLHTLSSQELVELLIDKGADVNAKNNKGNTPLDKIFEQQFFSLDYYRKNDSMELIELLITKGAQFNVNVRLRDQATPLHAVAASGNKAVVEGLLAQGAEVNAKDDWGLTPLDWATVTLYPDIVELLKSHGGINSCRNLDEVTAICNAVYPYSRQTFLKYFIRYKNSHEICTTVHSSENQADYSRVKSMISRRCDSPNY
jgi:serine/threonine protein kinase